MDARSLSRTGLLAAGAVAAYVFESLLPMPLPWARIGLSNVFVVIALFGFGFKDAFLVNLARVLAGNLLLGILLSPAFVFSFAGSTCALMAMAVVRWKLVPPLSVVGASCIGAAVNNFVQVMLFTTILSWSGIASSLLGGFILMGVGVGFVTGLIASRVLDKVILERTGSVG
ncbi:MAG: Gx transporter family protein [Candidatus Eisenbacteria bacterium]